MFGGEKGNVNGNTEACYLSSGFYLLRLCLSPHELHYQVVPV